MEGFDTFYNKRKKAKIESAFRRQSTPTNPIRGGTDKIPVAKPIRALLPNEIKKFRNAVVNPAAQTGETDTFRITRFLEAVTPKRPPGGGQGHD